MTSANSDSDNSNIEPPKKKMGRPITALWRYRPDGTYNKNCADPNQYYRDHIAFKINCPLCSKLVGQQKIKRHQSTTLCMKNRKDNNIV